MLSKGFRKYITPEQRRKFLQIFNENFNNQEYIIFLKKFRGSMISKGRRSVSYKLFDKLRIYFKRVLKILNKKTKKNLEFDMFLRKAIFNLIPVLGTSNVRRGWKVQTVPSLLKFRKRVVLINKWLIRNQKNKSNVRGIKINDVSRIIAYSHINKGSAYDQKMDNLKKAYAAKHILLRMGGRYVNKRAFKRLQKKVLLELEEKHGILDKKVTIINGKVVKKPEILVESIGTLFNLIIFLKYKRKYKKVRRITKDLRHMLMIMWRRIEKPLERRWKYLWQWIVYASKRKEFKINRKKFNMLKPKYKLVCADIVRRTGL